MVLRSGQPILNRAARAPAFACAMREGNMPAYVFSQVTIVDNDKYQQEFLPAVLKSHEAYGVKYLARTGDIEALEGHAPMRCVILEFQDIAHALLMPTAGYAEADSRIAKSMDSLKALTAKLGAP